MKMSLGKSEKLVQIDNIQTNTYHLVKKVVIMDLVDPEILWLKLKKGRN